MTYTTEYNTVKSQLEILVEVGQAINSVLEVDRLLGIIAERTANLLAADRCSIYVVDEDRGILWTQAAMGSTRIEIPIATGIAGAVARTGAVVNIPDAYNDPRFNPEVDKVTGYRTRSVLASPMMNLGGRAIGVIQLLNKREGVFNEEDEQLLTGVSGFAGNALEKALLHDELKLTFWSMLQGLAATIEGKHAYTAGHTQRVAEYSCGIAEALGLERNQVEVLRVAAYLHDYGKISIPDAVLTKPGRLSTDEYKEMQRHAAQTYEILSRMHFGRIYRDVPLIASSHHERWDGKGYPRGLAGEQIPLLARIMAYADVFDAVTSDRDYRKAMPFPDAFALVKKEVGSAFDPGLFEAFQTFYIDSMNARLTRK